jgi:hypothetical protein
VVAPPATIIALIAAVSVIAPWVHYHMITAVSAWPMRFDVLVFSPLRFLAFYTLLPVALGIMILIRPGITFRDPKMRWLLAASICASLGGLLTYSKAGGNLTAFMPALIPLIVLSTLGLAAAWKTVSASLISPGRAWMFACLIALMMMVDGVETTREAMHLFVEGLGDGHYPQVVEYVSKLKGRVICPDDPTIPIAALEQPGRSYWAESDTHFWVPMRGLVKEIGGADYVITVNSLAATFPKPDQLRDLGFVPDSWGDGADLGPYELWRKREAADDDHESHLN